MKTSGLCFVLILLAGSFSALCAQSEEQNFGKSNIRTDPAAIQSWLSRSEQAQGQRMRDDNLIISQELVGSEICAYMRTYRVKREARGSDVTRPAGYTTCVPSARFAIKSAVEDFLGK